MLSDNEVIIILMVGPITPTEIQHVQRCAQQMPGTYKIMLCGTRLSSPDDVAKDFVDDYV